MSFSMGLVRGVARIKNWGWPKMDEWSEWPIERFWFYSRVCVFKMYFKFKKPAGLGPGLARSPRLWPARRQPPRLLPSRVKQHKHRLIITDGPSFFSLLVTIFSFCASMTRLECSLMCNVNVVNRISSYCLIFFFGIRGGFGHPGLPWL